MRHVLFGALFALVLTAGCGERWQRRSLSGNYTLIHPELCWDDVETSLLVLRADGTFDQYLRLKNLSLAIQSEHWTYDQKTKRISFSKFLKSYENSFEVEPSHPAMIFVDSSRKCYYQHPK
jgi:hypothetical protein